MNIVTGQLISHPIANLCEFATNDTNSMDEKTYTV